MIKLKLNPKKLKESLIKSSQKEQESPQPVPATASGAASTPDPKPSNAASNGRKKKKKDDSRAASTALDSLTASQPSELAVSEPVPSPGLPKISFRNPALPKIKVKTVTKKRKADTESGPAEELPDASAPDAVAVKKPKIKLSTPSTPAGDTKTKKASTKKQKTEPVDHQLVPKVSFNLKTKKEALPRIRVKASRQPGQGYDSEAPDQEDDPMIEEAIILRMVPGAHLDYLRATCDAGDLSRINIKFKDSRRAVVSINEQLFAAKLVDLPTITEAHKTFDRKNIYKVSDICQMLLVTEPIAHEDDVFHLPSTSIDRPDSTSIPHGITPPLHNVKHRRFRKRISRKAIESMEAKLEELFRLDAEAEETQYDLLDPSMMNQLSSVSTAAPSRSGSVPPRGSTPQARKDSLGAPSPSVNTPDDAPTPYNMLSSRAVSPAPGTLHKNADDEEEEEEGEDEDLLGMELERALEESEESDDEDDDDDDDDESEDEQNDDINTVNGTGLSRDGNKTMDEETLEAISYNKILREEIKDLEISIRKKRENAENTSNSLLRDRFLKVVKKLEQELEVKKRQLKHVGTDDNSKKSNSAASKTNEAANTTNPNPSNNSTSAFDPSSNSTAAAPQASALATPKGAEESEYDVAETPAIDDEDEEDDEEDEEEDNNEDEGDDDGNGSNERAAENAGNDDDNDDDDRDDDDDDDEEDEDEDIESLF
ncbi:similar to Saccharomyces cerevisiae YMR227C TAF7 TFIID subunit (67 kDa), involved in RNA polymerase II transcription initiation [Geotrichum candidum]|uniref:Similar to Saccharomyces cerevisiae YMR227C TAF7 TFIID subunit (67 kDa), involved in RNA polymerase II transcription initiation n=1 Tax=Geotrichum candidum TaxID=1173061 RepID=A0A0J9XA18_GEOCN|nr:similar to Saccharomyces cerevisiae YMR227C TAF7 TFIID subunit (67 kDa), involved in RNA polymerase II transcription initiation [Geotrichum candidum]